VKNCGTPRFFCDSGGWALCDDYRDIFCPMHCEFPTASRAVSAQVFSSTDPGYLPYDTGGPPEFPDTGWFGNDQEHIHSEVEDGNFGAAVMRQHQPFDFAQREGHVHFEVDLKTSARRYVRLTLTPELFITGTDDRSGQGRPCPALDIWFQNGGEKINSYPASCPADDIYGSVLTQDANGFEGQDNVRNLVDVYVSRTHVRIVVDGQAQVDVSMPDIGFDRAYVYLSQNSYHPVKDGEGAPNLQIFHWDNVAFDGPVLADNALTPAGYQDVMFNVFGADACSVNGIGGASAGPPTPYTWITWRVRMPVQTVDPSAARCSGPDGFEFWDGVPRSFEVVRP
jgi:hypothetical protein